MRTLWTLLIASMVVFSAGDLQAQSFKDKLLNKMKKKGEDKVIETFDRGANKAASSTEEAVKKGASDKASDKSSTGSASGMGGGTAPNTNTNTNKQTSTTTQPSGQTGGSQEPDMSKFLEMFGGESVDINSLPDIPGVEASKYKGSFDMHFEDYKNGKLKDQGDVQWFFDAYHVVMIPDIEQNGEKVDGGRLIIYRQKGVMAFLSEADGKKTGFIMDMPTQSDATSNAFVDEHIESMNVEVNRNIKKTFEGESCYQVKTWDDTYESVSWVSDNVGLQVREVFGYMSAQNKGQKDKYKEKFGDIQGWPMQTESTDKKTGEKSIMTTKNMKTGTAIPANLLSTDGFELMKMPNLGGMNNGGNFLQGAGGQ